MKKILIISLALLNFNLAYMQTDIKNQQKYWKFRNSFRQDFIRIGLYDGESLPMGRRGFGKCVDNTSTYGGQKFGQLYWGDGVIRHGHYIGFLATEYRLLKNQGKDVTAVLNELYYALQAFNRLDYNAEIIISQERGNIPDENIGNYNGFYLRDDIPKDFDDHWKDEPIRARGVHGLYTNNNSGHIDSENDSDGGEYDAEISHNFGWSTPSLDQMTSILVGLVVCDKLLDDNLWVQPTPNDNVILLSNEVKQITNRIISYAYNHNWQLLDMYGWPVENGGGELVFTAAPIATIGYNMLGNDYFSNNMHRRASWSKQFLVAKYIRLENQVDKDAMWDTLSLFERGKINYFNNIPNNWPSGQSNYETWLNGGNISVPVLSSDFMWLSGNLWQTDLFTDWSDNHKFDYTFPSNPLGLITFDRVNLFKDYNNTIFMNLGVASNLYSKTVTKEWEDVTHNHQLSLIKALLTNDVPVNSKQFYKDLLNSMPVYGAFKFRVNETNGAWNDPAIMSQTVFPTDWGGEYRWTHYGESTTPEKGNEGQYTGLDYMYLHNLYYLVFPENLPEFNEEYSCICDAIENSDLQISNTFLADTGIYAWDDTGVLNGYLNNVHIFETSINYTPNAGPGGYGYFMYTYLPQSDYDAVQNDLAQNGGFLNGMVYELSNLQPCVPNDFIDLGNFLNTQYTMGMLHDNYEAIKVYTNNYQTEMFTVQNGGKLDVKSRVIVCEDQALNIQTGGIVKLLSGEIRVNNNATIYLSGELFINNHQKLILEDGAKLVILPGGLLYNSGDIIVNNNAQIIYHPNAKIKMDQEFAEINFKGGDLYIEDNANFSVIHGNTASGQLRFSTWGKHIYAGQNTKFKMEGVNNDDVILIINKNGDFWSESNANGRLNKIHIAFGKVMLHENARFVSTANNLYTFDVKFVCDASNRGIVTFDKTYLVNSEFNGVNVKSVNIYRPYAFFRAENCLFNVTDGYLPNNGGFQKALTVNGKIYHLDNCVFNTENSTTVFSENLNYTSTVMGCKFNNPNNFECKIEDQSNVLLLLKSNIFNTSYKGVLKKYGTLGLRCNFFNNCYDAIKLYSYAKLNMSTSGLSIGYGYNKFLNTYHNDINFDHAGSPMMNNGYNDFSLNNPYGKTFEGNAYILDAGVGPVITAQKNAWNGQAIVASQSNFNVYSLFTNSNVSVNSTIPYLSYCGEFDGSINSNPSYYIDNFEPDFENSNNSKGSYMSLNQLIMKAVNMSEIYDSLGNNLESINLFYNIIMYDYSTIENVNMIEVAKILNYTFYEMKYTIHDAFAKGQIDIKNSKSVSPYIVKFIDVLNKRSTFIQLLNKKEEVFFHEIEKVEFLRIFGKYDLIIDILNNIEYCGNIDSLEQDVLNSFKFNILEEKASINYGYEASLIDTTFTDTSSFTRPIHQDVKSYGFNSVINDLNNVSFVNDCNGKMASINSINEEVQISVYPNPSLNIVNFDVDIDNDNDFGGLINIYAMDSKLITSIKLNSGHNNHQIDFGDYESGVYYYSLIIDGNNIKNGKIVIQN